MTVDATEKTPMVPEPGLAGLRRLTRWWFGFIVVFALSMLAVAWQVGVRQGAFTHVEALFGFAASLGASALWWLLFAWTAERHLSEMVRDEIRVEREQAARERDGELASVRAELCAAAESRERAIALMRQEITAAAEARDQEIDMLMAELRDPRTVQSELPAAVYRGQERTDLRFTRDLGEHLARSSRYYFTGPTAVYVGARVRLRETGPALRVVQVRITDPTSAVAVEHAIKHRQPRSDHRGKGGPTIREELLDDIYMAVIGLFDARVRAHAVHVLHERRASNVRLELFDDALYQQMIDTDERANFTRTIQWERHQPTYQQLDRMVRDGDTCSKRVTFQSTHDEGVLIGHIEKLGFDPGRIEQLRARYKIGYVDPLELAMEAARDFSETLPVDEPDTA